MTRGVAGDQGDSGRTAAREPLSIAVVQARSHGGDLQSAVAEHVARISEAGEAGAALVVFPELSLSGYEPDLIDLHGLRIDPGHPALTPILRECRKWSVHALIGAPVSGSEAGAVGGRSTDGLPGIGIMHVDPEGNAAVVYRKQYLDIAETGIFAAGSAPGTVTIQGWRLALSICRDAAVIDHIAAAAKSGADVYVVAALFLIGAEHRIEDQMRVVTSYRMWAALAQYSGGTGGGPACGGSGIWGPDGAERVRLDAAPGMGIAELTT